MVNSTTLKSPYPYFGGKSRVADVVWQAFGDTPNYVEPFFGSGAVLLARPHYPFSANRIETVNELNPYIANFYRSIQLDPEKTAYYADTPVNETDLHSRHRWLVNQDGFKERMTQDPDYYDPKIAGWWIWGMCAWIGQGFCSDKGKLSNQIPHLGDAGMGINRTTTGDIYAYFEALSERFRRVRVTCGDWSRVMGESVTCKNGITSVFLDPPYPTSSELYHNGKTNVAVEVLEWCKANWDNPKLRIAYCGYEGDLSVPDDWQMYKWTGAGGYQSNNKGNKALERIWFSPACLLEKNRQSILFIA